jgi:hypothetical protein
MSNIKRKLRSSTGVAEDAAQSGAPKKRQRQAPVRSHYRRLSPQEYVASFIIARNYCFSSNPEFRKDVMHQGNHGNNFHGLTYE